MQSLVLAAVLSLAAARPQLPAGLSAAECPNYPFCGATSPADFPVPVVNGAPVAPILNTTPEQTQDWQQAQVAQSPAAFPCHNCQWRERCSRLQHGARPDCCPREPPADRPTAATAAADRRADHPAPRLAAGD